MAYLQNDFTKQLFIRKKTLKKHTTKARKHPLIPETFL